MPRQMPRVGFINPAMRILGMTLWPEKLSDEQYVEQTRKRLQKLGRWRYFIALISLVTIILIVFLIFQGIHLLGNIADMGRTTRQGAPNPARQIVYAIYYLAVVIGGFAGFVFGNTVSHIAFILFAYRKDKLLVECWDALSDAEKSRLRQRSS